MESFIGNLVQAFNSPAGLTAIIVLIIISIISSFVLIVRLMTKQSAMDNRQEVHADYFDILKEYVDQSKSDLSSMTEANVKMIDSFTKFIDYQTKSHE